MLTSKAVTDVLQVLGAAAPRTALEDVQPDVDQLAQSASWRHGAMVFASAAATASMPSRLGWKELDKR